MAKDRTNYVEVIRKLLEKAESTTFEAEREAFTAKAYNLMTEWAIDEAEVRARDAKQDVFVDSWIVIGKTYYKEDLRLVDAIGRVTGVYVIADRGFYDGEWQNVALLCGYEYAIERVKMLYTSLLIQRTRSLNDRMKGVKGTASQKYNIRRSFMGGFAHAVQARLEATLNDGGPNTGSMLPALRSDRERAQDFFLGKLGADGTTVRKVHSSYGAGYGEGARAGSSADINQPRVQSRNARALNAG